MNMKDALEQIAKLIDFATQRAAWIVAYQAASHQGKDEVRSSEMADTARRRCKNACNLDDAF